MMSSKRLVLVLLTLSGLGNAFPFRLTPREEVLQSCLSNAEVPLLTSSDVGFTQAAKPFNNRLPYKVALIAIPETKEQVAEAVKCASSAGIKVQPRGGGHSYSALALGGADGSFMIDMKRFQTVSVDPETYQATVGAGARLGTVILGLNATGRAMPHGTCPAVGIGGHALHGGFGFASRLWGLASDGIQELEVVLANGTIAIASDTQNTDLFWALRGAGSSFGIVTQFKFKTYPQPETAVSFSYRLGATSSIERQVEIWLAVQEYGKNAPKEVGLRLFVASMAVQVSGVYWGTRAEAEAALEPLGKLLNSSASFTARNYMSTLQSTASGVPFKQPIDYDIHETFYAKSLVTDMDHPLTADTIRAFTNYTKTHGTASDTNWWVMVDLYGGKESLVTKVNLDATSYAHRNALFTIQLYANSKGNRLPYPDTGIEFVQGMVDTIVNAQPDGKFSAYINYGDSRLSAKEAQELYWGEQYSRLLELKKKYDPGMVFWNPQAVGAE